MYIAGQASKIGSMNIQQRAATCNRLRSCECRQVASKSNSIFDDPPPIHLGLNGRVEQQIAAGGANGQRLFTGRRRWTSCEGECG